ncbi:MAG TPA: polysaccharide deacetylase family protein [Vicinamibacterales bacterium]|nr:polysaccharide deacetylase family protein [Vicinamibacterales bacterium]
MNHAGTLVLLYHRVAQLEHDPYGLAVRPERFAEQCEILRQHYDVVPLRDAKGSRLEVAITFDDGYADNRAAAAMLAAADLPATFFITIGRIGERREVWWDRLEQLVMRCAPAGGYLDLEVAGKRFWADVRSPSARARAHMALYWRVRRMRPTVIESLLDRLEEQLAIRTVERNTHRWMTREELRELAGTTGIDVGAHTVTHPVLTAVSASDQWEEIDGGRQQLEHAVGKPIRLFSYPYGGDDAFDDATHQRVRDAGYTSACTTTGGLASVTDDSFQIPRNVVGDWDAQTFEGWLNHWVARTR